MASIKQLKNDFLDQYNPSRTEAEALSKAISVSVGHNALYKEGISEADKTRVRTDWKAELKALSAQYKAGVDENQHEDNIVSLANAMNRKHRRRLIPTGFKISHAQKSLSVYLKHLWCMGLIPEPPQCPVDRRILEVALKKKNVPAWTKVTTIEEHRKLIAILREAVGGKTLAVWELEAFPGKTFPTARKKSPNKKTKPFKGNNVTPSKNKNRMCLKQGPQHYTKITDNCSSNGNIGMICHHSHHTIWLKSPHANCRHLIGEIVAAGGNFRREPGYRDLGPGEPCVGGTNYQGGVPFSSFDDAVKYLKQYFKVNQC